MLWERYEPCFGETIEVSELKEEFKASTTLEEKVQDAVLGRVMKWAFPSVQRKKITSMKYTPGESVKRPYCYVNLSRIRNHCHITWQDVAKYDVVPRKPCCKTIMPWTIVKRTEEIIQWLIITNNDICNGKQVTRELCIFRDMSVKLIMSNKTVLDFSHVQCLTTQLLHNLMEFCAEVPLCKGFEVGTNVNTKNVQGIVNGVTEEWKVCDPMGNNITSQRLRAIDCLQILSAHEMKCRNCEYVRSNCHKNIKINEEVKNTSIRRKRISYMNTDEIKKRLYEERARAYNAERKAARAIKVKEEIAEQMEEFTKEDSKYFNVMFKNIDESELSEEMKLFLP